MFFITASMAVGAAAAAAAVIFLTFDSNENRPDNDNGKDCHDNIIYCTH